MCVNTLVGMELNGFEDRSSQKRSKEIPNTWLVYDEGVSTTDPQYFGNGGALQPMAAHKGYGLSILVDVLSGVLSGGAITNEMTSWCFDLPANNRASHTLLR